MFTPNHRILGYWDIGIMVFRVLGYPGYWDIDGMAYLKMEFLFKISIANRQSPVDCAYYLPTNRQPPTYHIRTHCECIPPLEPSDVRAVVHSEVWAIFACDHQSSAQSNTFDSYHRLRRRHRLRRSLSNVSNGR